MPSMFQLQFPSCLHLVNATHFNQKHFLHSHHPDECYKQHGIFSRHPASSLSAWTREMRKEALGLCLWAITELRIL